MITRYVNTASTTGGDGTTNATSGANRAYPTLRAALDAIGASLSDAMTIVCDGAGGADTSDCDQGAWDFTTTASNYLLITTQGSARHQGKWDTAKYHRAVTNQNGLYNNLAAHIRFDGLQVQVTVNDAAQYIVYKTINANLTATDIDCRITNCIAKGVMTSGQVLGYNPRPPGAGGAGVSSIWNCLAFDCDKGFASDWASQKFWNCTGHTNTFDFDGMEACEFRNCLSAAPATSGWVGVASGSSSHNASSDDSAPGSRSRSNQTFTFVDVAGDDFHLQSTDAGAKGFGVRDPGSGLFADDIGGQARGLVWDIGMDQETTVVTVPDFSLFPKVKLRR